jgi:hypothetical protein
MCGRLLIKCSGATATQAPLAVGSPTKRTSSLSDSPVPSGVTPSRSPGCVLPVVPIGGIPEPLRACNIPACRPCNIPACVRNEHDRLLAQSEDIDAELICTRIWFLPHVSPMPMRNPIRLSHTSEVRLSARGFHTASARLGPTASVTRLFAPIDWVRTSSCLSRVASSPREHFSAIHRTCSCATFTQSG